MIYREMKKVYGTSIGKPDLKYADFSYEDFKGDFMGMEASESLANKLNELVESVNSGKLKI